MEKTIQKQGPDRQEVGILGRKLGMTQIYNEQGQVVPVTVVQAGPCPIVQVKTKKSDGYNAIQIGFGDITEKHVNKPRAGHFKRANLKATRNLRELRQSPDSVGTFQVGQEIKVDIFKAGDMVDVVGKSIGKGFQGVMKRHNMRGMKASRGVHEAYRHGGSLGCRFPQRVNKGKRMAGHMGDVRVTMLNLAIVDVKPEQNLIFVRGAVPGKKDTLVLVRKAVKA